VITALLTACGSPAPAPADLPAHVDPWPVSAGFSLAGVCDVSAAVTVSRFLVVADRAHPALSVFDWAHDAAPAGTIDLAALHPDLAMVAVEGLTVGPDGRVWAASTDRLFALRVAETPTGLEATLAAGPTARLTTVEGHLSALDGLVPSAAGRPSTDPLSLTLGGLVTDADGSLVVAFQTPVQAGKALLEPIGEPDAYVAGEAWTTSGPRWLGLAGRGVRAIERDGDHLLVLAGAPHATGSIVLARASSPPDRSPPALLQVAFGDLAPGALFAADGAWWVVSDDGARCDPEHPSARTARVPAGALVTGGTTPTP
jgi:hypothetical protein